MYTATDGTPLAEYARRLRAEQLLSRLAHRIRARGVPSPLDARAAANKARRAYRAACALPLGPARDAAMLRLRARFHAADVAYRLAMALSPDRGATRDALCVDCTDVARNGRGQALPLCSSCRYCRRRKDSALWYGSARCTPIAPVAGAA
jgi:hypothetical protein